VKGRQGGKVSASDGSAATSCGAVNCRQHVLTINRLGLAMNHCDCWMHTLAPSINYRSAHEGVNNVARLKEDMRSENRDSLVVNHMQRSA